MTGGTRAQPVGEKPQSRAVAAVVVEPRKRLSTPGLQQLGRSSHRGLLGETGFRAGGVEGWVVGGCARGSLSCRSWPEARGPSEPANSRLLGLGLAHIHAGERVSEADLLVAKPEVGGGLSCRFDGGSELVGGRCLRFGTSRR